MTMNDSPLLAKQYRSFITNRLVQHLIAFIMLLALIIIIGKVHYIDRALLYSLGSYLLFIFMTKLDIQWNIMALITLLFGFLYENNMILKMNESNNDPVLEKKIKNKIKEKHETQQKIIISIIVLLSVIGMYLYNDRKQVQYGGGYNPITFLLF
jgi:hypothetical protein